MVTTLLSWMLGCAPGGAEATSTLDATLSSAGGLNSWVLEWETETATSGEVVYGDGDELDHLALDVESDADGLSHRVVLAGLAGSTTWRVQAESDGATSEVFEIETEPVPPSLPSLSVSVQASDDLGGFVVLPLATMEGVQYAIVDLEGRYVWWREEFASGSFRGSFDSSGALTWLDDMPPEGSTFSWTSVVDGEEGELATADGHHDFVTVPGSGFLTIGQDLRESGSRMVAGDTLVHVPFDGGAPAVVWSAWDTWEYDGTGVESPNHVSWPHINSLDYDATTGKAMLGVFSRDSVAQVDVATGALDWELGGIADDYGLAEEARFVHPHSPRRVGDEIWLIDAGQPDGRARAMAIDIASEPPALAWDYEGGAVGGTSVLGNAEYIDDDKYLVAWGSAGSVAIVDRSGEVYWQLDASLGTAIGYAQYLPSLVGANR
ncbi:MAG: hypothetical protein FJ102_03520 [Deltaproteobacteria bacterium]|nr:hypothetical protein [Deltaproteobacteria bacterium]